jgi:hypothetical protein
LASLPPKNAAAPDPDLVDGSIGADAGPVRRGAPPDAEHLGATRPHTPEGTTEVAAAHVDGLTHERTFVSDETGPPIVIRRAARPRTGRSPAPTPLVKPIEQPERQPQRSRVSSLRRRLQERSRAIARRPRAGPGPLRQPPARAVSEPPPEARRAPAASRSRRNTSPEDLPPEAGAHARAALAPPPTPAPTNAFRPQAAPSEALPDSARYREEVATLRSQLRRTRDEVDYWRRGMLLSLLIAAGAAAAFFWPF